MKAPIIAFLTFSILLPFQSHAKTLQSIQSARVKRQITQSSASASASSGSTSGSSFSGGGGGFQLNDFLAQLPFFNQRYNGDDYYDDYNGARGGYSDYHYPQQNYYPQVPRQYTGYPQNSRFPQLPRQNGGFVQNSQFAGAGAGASVGDLARIGGNPASNSGRTSTTFTSSNVNGIQSATGVNVDPQGRVSTFRSGPNVPNTFQTRTFTPGAGQVNGVYSSSSTHVGPDGRVVSNQNTGHF